MLNEAFFERHSIFKSKSTKFYDIYKALNYIKHIIRACTAEHCLIFYSFEEIMGAKFINKVHPTTESNDIFNHNFDIFFIKYKGFNCHLFSQKIR